MMKYLRISVASLALCTLAVAPATVIVTADVAIAKSDNGGGKGNGGGNGGGAGKGKSGDKAGKGKSGAKSKGAKNKGGKSFGSRVNKGSVNKGLKSFGNKVKSGFGLLDGIKGNKRTASRKSSGGAVKENRGVVKGFDHPSNLGALNGAINSSPNAKLAHIRNGNYNGPVGLAAAYAVANAEYADAETSYLTAQETIAELGPLADAYDYVAAYDDAVEAFNALPDDVDTTTEEYAALQAAANEATYNSSLGTIADAEAMDPAVSEESVDSELAGAAAVEEPDRMALDDAETNLLGLYKGDETALDEINEETGLTNREALLDSINLPTEQQVLDARPPEGAEPLSEEEETADATDDTVIVADES